MPEQSVRDAIETNGPDARFFGNQPRSFGKKINLAPQPEETTPERPKYLGQRLLQLEKIFLAEKEMIQAAMDPSSQVEVIINNPTRPEEFDPTKPFDVSPNQKPYLDKDAETKAIERRLQIEQAIAKINEQKKTNLYEHSVLALPLLEIEALQHGHDLSADSIDRMDYTTTQAILSEPWIQGVMIRDYQFNQILENIRDRADNALVEEALFNMQRQGLIGTLSDFLWNREEDVSTFVAEGHEDSTNTHNILSKMLNKWKGGPKINNLKKKISSAIKKQEEKIWEKFVMDYRKNIDNRNKQKTLGDFSRYYDVDFERIDNWYHDNNPSQAELEDIKLKTILKILERYKNSPYKIPLPKELKTLQEQIELVKTESFEKQRAKQTEKTLSIIRLLTTVEFTPIYNELFSDLISSYDPDAPDSNPLRPIKAATSIIELTSHIVTGPDQGLEHTLEFLQDSEKVSPIIEYLLIDYFESAQYFNPTERSELIKKTTEFIGECAARFDPQSETQEGLVEYINASSDDLMLQKALAFSLLPFAAYTAEHEDMVREIALKMKSQDPLILKYFSSISPNIGRIIHSLLTYDPENITIDYDGDTTARNGQQYIEVPHEVISALNKLGENPHYISPGEFIPTVQDAYTRTWTQTYGTEPPPIFRETDMPISEDRSIINQVIEGVLSGDSKLLEDDQIGFEYKARNQSDWFLYSTINTPSYFSHVFHAIDNADPYKEKFGFSEQLFTDYYQGYINFIQKNGSPKEPIPETDLFAYALVKCNGNYTEATKEMAMLYKFITRYNLETGLAHNLHKSPDPTISGGQHFYRTTFREVNIPILLSIQNEQSQYEQATPLLMEMPVTMSDIYENDHNIGDKDGDAIDLSGWHYHAWANRAITQLGYATPYQIAVGHAINEFPFFVNLSGDNSLNFTATPSGSSKYATMVLAIMDNILINEIVKKTIPTTTEVLIKPPPTIFTQSILTSETPAIVSRHSFNSSSIIKTITPEFGYYASVSPNNPEQTTIYYGHPDFLKQNHNQRFAGSYLNLNRQPGQFILEPQLLTAYTELELPLPASYLSMITKSTDLEALRTYLQSGHISLTKNPEYLPLFIRLDLPIANEDLFAIISQYDLEQASELNSVIESNLPTFSKVGIISSSEHPIVVNALASTDVQAQLGFLNYFHTLDTEEQQRILSDQEKVSNFYRNLENIYRTNHHQNGAILLDYPDENVSRDIELLTKYFPKIGGNSNAQRVVPYLFPYFSSNDLIQFISSDEPSTEWKIRNMITAYVFLRNPELDSFSTLTQVPVNTQALVRELKLSPDPIYALAGNAIDLATGEIEQDTFDTILAQNISQNPEIAFTLDILGVAHPIYFSDSPHYNSPGSVNPILIDSLGDALDATKGQNHLDGIRFYSDMVAKYGSETHFMRYLEQSTNPRFTNHQEIAWKTINNWLETYTTTERFNPNSLEEVFAFLFSERDTSATYRHYHYLYRTQLVDFYQKWGKHMPQENFENMRVLGAFDTAPESIRYQLHQEMLANGHTQDPSITIDTETATSELSMAAHLSISEAWSVNLIHEHLTVSQLTTIVKQVELPSMLFEEPLTIFDINKISEMDGYNPETTQELANAIHSLILSHEPSHNPNISTGISHIRLLNSCYELLSSQGITVNYFEEVSSTLRTHIPDNDKDSSAHIVGIEIINLSLFSNEQIAIFQQEFPDIYTMLTKSR